MHPDGSWTEERFSDGKEEGRSVEYSAEGQLLQETFFQAGKKHGTERTFTEDGKLDSEQYWSQGVKGKKPEPPLPAPAGDGQAPAPTGDAAAKAPQQ
jgi:antitoxin component YwqK of YwqJK toxin-antitoxin module